MKVGAIKYAPEPTKEKRLKKVIREVLGVIGQCLFV
jgi:hypothetical protein